MKKLPSNVIAAIIIGNVLEWYDFVLFGVFATLFATQFFPHEDVNAALLSSFGVFAVGYLMRPIGGALIGHLGDKHSRKVAMIISLLVMGTATSLIGLLPTYAAIGLWAPILLVLFRMIQGLAVGGEFPGSIVILAEQAPDNRKAFVSSLSIVGAGLGMLAGSGAAVLLSALLSHQQVVAWGWRIPFLIGFFLALVGLYIRTKLWADNSRQVDTAIIPFFELIQKYRSSLLKAVGIFSLGGVITGVLVIFLVAYLTHYLHYPPQVAYHLLLISTIAMVTMFPLSAYLADRFNNHRRWVMTGFSLLLVITLPLFIFMRQGIVECYAAVITLSIIYNFSCGPYLPLVVNLFPKQVRYSGIAVVHGVVLSIVGGTAPLILTWLISRFGLLMPAVYMMVFIALALIALTYTSYTTLSKEEVNDER